MTNTVEASNCSYFFFFSFHETRDSILVIFKITTILPIHMDGRCSDGTYQSELRLKYEQL